MARGAICVGPSNLVHDPAFRLLAVLRKRRGATFRFHFRCLPRGGPYGRLATGDDCERASLAGPCGHPC